MAHRKQREMKQRYPWVSKGVNRWRMVVYGQASAMVISIISTTQPRNFFNEFLDGVNVLNLRKLFTRFSRMGEVFVPKKMDKWGSAFCYCEVIKDW